eukprot:Nk52_evm1s377 gene=Nk52_evmTU1s377
MGKSKSTCVLKSNYPLYGVRSSRRDPEGNQVIIAGGGGAGKHGVPSLIEMYDIKATGRTGDGAKKLFSESTGDKAPNKLDIHPQENILATGMNECCYVFSFDDDKEGNPSLEKTEDVKTESEEEDSLQRVVRFSKCGKYLATGGTSGEVKVWEYPVMKIKYTLKAHTKDVNDIDFSFDHKRLITCGGDKKLKLWNLDPAFKGSDRLISVLETESLWFNNSKNPHHVKACRFGLGEEGEIDGDCYIYTAHACMKQKSYIVKWDIENFCPLAEYPTGRTQITTMALSPNCKHLAVGTNEGDILVLASTSKYLIRRVETSLEAHSFCVTDICFSNNGAKVFSVSADNQLFVTEFYDSGEPFHLWFLIAFWSIFFYLIYYIYCNPSDDLRPLIEKYVDPVVVEVQTTVVNPVVKEMQPYLELARPYTDEINKKIVTPSLKGLEVVKDALGPVTEKGFQVKEKYVDPLVTQGLKQVNIMIKRLRTRFDLGNHV